MIIAYFAPVIYLISAEKKIEPSGEMTLTRGNYKEMMEWLPFPRSQCIRFIRVNGQENVKVFSEFYETAAEIFRKSYKLYQIYIIFSCIGN